MTAIFLQLLPVFQTKQLVGTPLCQRCTAMLSPPDIITSFNWVIIRHGKEK